MSAGMPEADPLPARGPVAPGDPVIVCESVVRIHRHGQVEVQALQGLDLHVYRGEMIAVVGPSGAGKSTLLSILAGADAPTAGSVAVAGHDLTRMSGAERVQYRRTVVGLVQQQASRNLIPYLSAADNVAVPLGLAAYPRRRRAARSSEMLERFGVGHCADRLPRELSGGEQQRVAIAVALANDPPLLLADEPTGELDTETSHEIFHALRAASVEDGVTIVVVTHDPTVSGQVGRTVAIRDGRTSSEVLRHTEHTEDGQAQVVAQEFAVMDRAGRVQVPREFRQALALTRRVRLALEADHVALWPDRRG